VAKDSYGKISEYFGIPSVEQLIANHHDRFLHKYRCQENYRCQALINDSYGQAIQYKTYNAPYVGYSTIRFSQDSRSTSSSFHATVARSSAVGPFLLRVRWPGTHCLTASETRLCQPALSDVI